MWQQTIILHCVLITSSDWIAWDWCQRVPPSHIYSYKPSQTYLITCFVSGTGLHSDQRLKSLSQALQQSSNQTACSLFLSDTLQWQISWHGDGYRCKAAIHYEIFGCSPSWQRPRPSASVIRQWVLMEAKRERAKALTATRCFNGFMTQICMSDTNDCHLFTLLVKDDAIYVSEDLQINRNIFWHFSSIIYCPIYTNLKKKKHWKLNWIELN